MKTKSLFIAASICLSSVTQAEVINCLQTEPFVTNVYDLTNDTHTAATSAKSKQWEIPGMSLVITGPNTFEIQDQYGGVLQKLTLTYKGSNGMSPHVYPFEGGQGVNGKIVCESSKLKAYLPK